MGSLLTGAHRWQAHSLYRRTFRGANDRKRTMNKDQVAGHATDLKGKVKEATGKLVGSEKLQGEGLADQAVGKTQAKVGDAKEAVKKAIDKA
jgi:uncharacterized protein YjbJ (UPF0337 family)